MRNTTKTLVVLTGLLWVTACCTGVRRISTAGRPPVTLRNVQAPEFDKDGDDEAEDAPSEAAAFYLLRRTGGGPLPVEKLFEAKRHKDAMPVHAVGTRRPATARTRLSPRDASSGTADLGNWEFLGPGNIGGRSRALVIRPDDPYTMYIGAVGGGVWMTSDGGNSWYSLTDLMPSIAIATLAMDPNDPNTIYAGSGEFFTAGTGGALQGDSIRGAGIYKTTDGGNTWTLLPKPTGGNAFEYVNKIVISPNNSQQVYAATWAGVYSSPDGGNTWRLTLNRATTDGCQDLVIRTDQPTDYLFAACAWATFANPGIFRNTDAAGNGKWQSVFTADHMARTTLALAPSNQSIIYAAVQSSQSGVCPSDNSNPPECYKNGLLGVWRSMSNGDSGSWTQHVSNQDPTFLNTLLFSNPRGAFADVCSGGNSVAAIPGPE